MSRPGGAPAGSAGTPAPPGTGWRSRLSGGSPRPAAASVSSRTSCSPDPRAVRPAPRRHPAGPSAPPGAPEVYGGRRLQPAARPWLADDTGSRPIRALPLPSRRASTAKRFWRAVGVFDPGRLAGFSDLGQLPLETYQAPTAAGCRRRSRAALGGQPLAPSGNPAATSSAPPLLLTNLGSVPKLLEGGGGRTRPGPDQRDPGPGRRRGRLQRTRRPSRSGWSPSRSRRAPGWTSTSPSARRPPRRPWSCPPGSFGRPVLRLTEELVALGWPR